MIEDALVRFIAMALLFCIGVLSVTGGVALVMAVWDFWAGLLS